MGYFIYPMIYGGTHASDKLGAGSALLGQAGSLVSGVICGPVKSPVVEHLAGSSRPHRKAVVHVMLMIKLAIEAP